MKALITGSRGQLGRALLHELGPHMDTVGIDLAECPVEDRDRVIGRCLAERPEIIIHTAAMTDVDGCELDPEAALRVNAIGSRNVALAARRLDCRLVHISTDFVFSGDEVAPYDEWATPSPINIYGRTKWLGEQWLRQLCPEALVCRVAWLFGENPGNFIRRMLERAREGKAMRVVDDQWGNPTWTIDVAAQIRVLLDHGEVGLFHTVSRGGCSRFELVRFLLDQAGLSDVSLEPVSSAVFPTPARRPRDSRLRTNMLDVLGLNRMPTWQEVVARYVQQL